MESTDTTVIRSNPDSRLAGDVGPLDWDGWNFSARLIPRPAPRSPITPTQVGVRPERVDGDDVKPVIGDIRVGAEVKGDANQER